MNKTRKIELLYKKAKGQAVNLTEKERRELSRYRVRADEGSFYATKANIRAYVTAVDNGSRLSFYDWCMNNHKADRRRRGSGEAAMERSNREYGMTAMGMGWLIWGMALYWLLKGNASAGTCAILGGIIAAVLYSCARRAAAFTLFVLPILIAVIFGL